MRSFIVIIIGIVIGGCIGYSYFHFIEMANFRAAAWKTSPVVVDCTEGVLAEKRLEAAIDYWSGFDHHVAFVERDPSAKICSNDFIYGFIIIKTIASSWPVLGETHRNGTINRKINSARIELSEDSVNLPRLLEHELGHAFGYRHKNVKGHMMHSDYDLSGYDFWE